MMSRKQLLCLGVLLAIIVCATAAYDDEKEDYEKEYKEEYKDYYKKEKKHKSHDKYGDYKEEDYPHHYPKSSPSPKPLHPPHPKCGPHMFIELKDLLCVNAKSGVCVPGNCSTVDPTKLWCKVVPGTQYSCVYEYHKPDYTCRPKDGPCDIADKCTGTSPTCPDKVENGTICHYSHSPCLPEAKCNGYSHWCPLEPARDGTPCSEEEGHAGLYSEVTDANGNLMTADADVAELEGKKHGYTKCHRCFDGKCVPFKYEWWWKSKHEKHYYDYDSGKSYEYPDGSYKEEYYQEYYKDYKPPKDFAEYDFDWSKWEKERKHAYKNEGKWDSYDAYKSKDWYESDKKSYYDEEEKEYEDDKKEYDDDKKEYDDKVYISSAGVQDLPTKKGGKTVEPWFWCHWKDEHYY